MPRIAGSLLCGIKIMWVVIRCVSWWWEECTITDLLQSQPEASMGDVLIFLFTETHAYTKSVTKRLQCCMCVSACYWGGVVIVSQRNGSQLDYHAYQLWTMVEWEEGRKTKEVELAGLTCALHSRQDENKIVKNVWRWFYSLLCLMVIIKEAR